MSQDRTVPSVSRLEEPERWRRIREEEADRWRTKLAVAEREAALRVLVVGFGAFMAGVAVAAMSLP